MTVINEEKDTLKSTGACMENPESFLAIITERFVDQDKHHRDCEMASKLTRKPMYAIVRRGTNWDNFKDFPWRMAEVSEDIDFFKTVGGV